MKKFALILIAAATLGVAAPASAQVSVGVGDVGVRVGSDRDRHEGWRREEFRHREHFADCRVVKERIETPSGRVIIKTRRECD